MDFKIFNGRNAFYQWDVNQRLILEGVSINDEIHFKNIDGRNAYVLKPYNYNGKIVVDVPNILLQSANSITVWVYVGDEYTKEQAVFNVIPRQKPADYVYTQTEVARWEVYKELIDNLPNEYAKKNHTHNYLSSESDPTVCDWAKKGSDYSITGNPVTLENFEHMPMNVITTFEPVQTGSGDPSPGNVRPISGYDKVTVQRTGKNILRGSEAERSGSNVQYATSDSFAGAEGQTITCSFDLYSSDGAVVSIYAYQLSGLCIDNGYDFFPGAGIYRRYSFVTKVKRYTDTANPGNIIFYSTSGAIIKVKNVQVEFGTKATDFEPHKGQTLAASIAETVYGGRMDWNTGVLTVDRGFIRAEACAWNMGSGGYWSTESIPAKRTKGNHIIAQIFSDRNKAVAANSLSSAANIIAVDVTGRVYINNGSTAVTPVGEIAYELANPFTIQLTPNDIAALDGVNNIYGDGEITVSGRKDVYFFNESLLRQIETLKDAIISLGGNV